MKIGIISDTHGLLRPETLEALRGCGAILHAGDINRQDVLDRLREIAPVYAVRGNNDREWAEGLPMTLEVELDGLRVCMAHRKKDLPGDPGSFDLAVCGHTHRYEETWLPAGGTGKTLLLNPGTCGPARFGRSVTMAVLTTGGGGFAVTRIDLVPPGGGTGK